MRTLSCIALLLIAAACSADTGKKAADSAAVAAATPPAPAEDLTKIDTALAPSLGVDLAKAKHLPSGLYVQDKRIGSGARADSGKIVRVHYTGWLADGKKFDSSRDRHQPLEFPVGYDRVIKGWDQGVRGMRVGGRRLIVVPPELGYGKAGKPGIVPSRATMVFDIELLGVR